MQVTVVTIVSAEEEKVIMLRESEVRRAHVQGKDINFT